MDYINARAIRPPIVTPDHPDHIPARRNYRRGVHFAKRELSRLVRLRDATEPLPAGEIASRMIAAFPNPCTPLSRR
jgi:hypothetical protein